MADPYGSLLLNGEEFETFGHGSGSFTKKYFNPQRGRVRGIMFPGSVKERTRYISLRLLPPLLVLLWLLIPLRGNGNCQSIAAFLLGEYLLYLVPALGFGWASFSVIIGIPSWRVVALLSTAVVGSGLFFAPFFQHLLHTNQPHVWRYTVPISMLGAGVPFLCFFLFYGWFKGRQLRNKVAVTAPLLSSEEEGERPLSMDKHSFTKRVVLMIALLGLFLLTFAFCDAFAIQYDIWTDSGAAGTPIITYFSIVGFIAGTNVLKLVTKAVAESLDTLMQTATDEEVLEGKDGKRVWVLFTYVMELLYYFFYRSLFMSVSRYETFVSLLALSLLIDFVTFPLQISRLAFLVLSKLKDTLLRRRIRTNTKTDYDKYNEENGLALFLRVCAEFVSLISFTANFLFIHYGWNRHFFEFPPSVQRYNSDYHMPNALVFLSFVPIVLVFEVVFVITARWYFIAKTKLDSFQLGVNYLKDKTLFIALFLATVHVAQDVIIARNSFNFCSNAQF